MAAARKSASRKSASRKRPAGKSAPRKRAAAKKRPAKKAASKRAAPRKRAAKKSAATHSARAGARRRPARSPLLSARRLKLALGIALLPLCWAGALALARSRGLWSPTDSLLIFGIGAGAAALAFWRLPRPMALYVFGHEATHAIAAMLCGGQVYGFRAGAQGGHVLTDRDNFFVSLAPYLFPLYTMGFLALGYALAPFVDLFAPLPGVGLHAAHALLALAGLSWGFHIVFTVWMIAKDQPDLQRNGIVFSLALILLANLFALALILALGSQEPALGRILGAWGERAGEIYSMAPRAAAGLWSLAARGFR